MIALEQDFLERMRAGQGQHHVLANVRPGEVERTYPQLSEHQRAAVEEILASHDQITALEGVAGAGKTTALAAIREATERAGYQVEGFAPTSRAAQKLVEAGIVSDTLRRHVAHQAPAEAPQPRFYILDESSLAGTTQLHAFLQRLGPEDRVLLVGDVRQHQAVEAGRPYQQLQEAGLATACLNQVVRQRDPALRAIVEQLARGDVPGAIQRLDTRGRVHEIVDREGRLTAIAREYVRSPDGTLVVSLDNDSRRALNEAIHRARQTVGHVPRRSTCCACSSHGRT